MKRIIALALSLMLVLGVSAGLADEKAELGSVEAFSIRSIIPEGYTFSLITSNGLNLVGILSGGEGKPTVTVSIAFSEEYAGVERFNDVDEQTVQEIKDSFLNMDDVVFEDLETAYGTRLLKVTQANRSFADIYSIYKGYETEFVVAAQSEVTDEDIQMLVQFISDMDFVAVK
ncbi:MAG: hypothetical protein IKG23_12005 [Clostridia bacterium]|nr:hypothetical protein [Clostridia bacterium]